MPTYALSFRYSQPLTCPRNRSRDTSLISDSPALDPLNQSGPGQVGAAFGSALQRVLPQLFSEDCVEGLGIATELLRPSTTKYLTRKTGFVRFVATRQKFAMASNGS
jgi:hypothetical protein